MSTTLRRCLLVSAVLLVVNAYMPLAIAGTYVLRLSSTGKDGTEKTTFNVGEPIYWNLISEGSTLPASATDLNCTPTPTTPCLLKNTGWNFGDNCFYHAIYTTTDEVNFTEYVADWPVLACAASGFTHWDKTKQSSNWGVSHTYMQAGTYIVYGDYVQTGVPFNSIDHPVPPDGFGALVGWAAGLVTIVDPAAPPPAAPPPTASIAKVLPVIISFILN